MTKSSCNSTYLIYERVKHISFEIIILCGYICEEGSEAKFHSEEGFYIGQQKYRQIASIKFTMYAIKFDIRQN